MTTTLNDFFIGHADGETESQEDLFKDMFYKDNQKYEEITGKWAKFIISGPKGSGKTILGRYIKAMYEDQDIQCKILKSDAITLNKLMNLGELTLETSEITLFYKWFILLEFSKVIFKKKLKHSDLESSFIKRFHADSKKKFNSYSQAYDKLLNLYNERFNKGNYENTSINTLEQINFLLSNDLNLKAPSTKLDIKTELKENFSQEKCLTLKPYFKMINEFEEDLLICMKYHKIILILDDIDEMKVKLDVNAESRIFLESLIVTLKDLNSKFKEHKIEHSKCILLLRSDILNTLNKYSSNLNKILADRQVELYWLDKDNKYPENHILIKMLFHKIRLSCNDYKTYSNKELYDSLFPEKIDGKSAINFLLDYSFGRPRDIFYYLNTIQKRFKDHTHFAPTSFIQCEAEYSNQLKNELFNELSLHLDIAYVEDLFRLVSDFKQLSFYYKDIKKYYDENIDTYSNITDLKKSLSDLYSFGILGNSFRVTDVADPKHFKKYDNITYSWAYRRDGSNEINFNQKLSVHYGLRSSLGLKKRNKKKRRKKRN